jgi:hypothetical protein
MKHFLLIALCTLLMTCKKKDPPDPTPPTPTPQAPTGTYYGAFSAKKFVFWADTFNTGSAYLAMVALHSTPTTELGLFASGENLGAVKSNSIQLRYDAPLQLYLDSTGVLGYSTTISFQHTSTALGSINYVSADTFPSYPLALVKQLSDTLDKTKNFRVPLNNITYYTGGTCLLYDGSLSLTGIAKNFTPGAMEVLFTPQEMSGFKTGNYYFVRVILQKTTDQTINGKLFRFTNETFSDFSVYVK